MAPIRSANSLRHLLWRGRYPSEYNAAYETSQLQKQLDRLDRRARFGLTQLSVVQMLHHV